MKSDSKLKETIKNVSLGTLFNYNNLNGKGSPTSNEFYLNKNIKKIAVRMFFKFSQGK